jgi:hypothetical protein
MNLKSTLIKWSMLLLFCQCFIPAANAGTESVYCNPTFTSGCTNWRNQGVTLGSINWTIGSTSCTVSDYTSTSTTLNPGMSYPMTVLNGDWCGVAVWIDFNQNQVFDAGENLYYHYNPQAAQTYSFNITIPGGTLPGSYRMRVVSGWGTDCFTTSGNGYGPCGTYTYGNFDDFTVNIIAVGIPVISDNASPLIEVSPNPASSFVTVTMNSIIGNEASLQLTDLTGKSIQKIKVNSQKEKLDISELPKGIYILSYVDVTQRQNIRLVK